jgi:hypothetical protein
MSMKSAADVSPAYEGMAVREYTISSPIGCALGDGDARSIYDYLAQQQNMKDAPQPTSLAPPMGMMVTANPASAQIDQQWNPLIRTEAT